MVIQVKSIGEPLARWLEPEKTSRVLARFESTIQLQGEDGQMWALTLLPNPGPFRMVAPALPVWKPGTRVRALLDASAAEQFDANASKGVIAGAGDQVAWDAAALWDPRPNRRPLNPDERRTAMQELAAFLASVNLPEVREFWDSLAETWDSFTEALRSQDVGALQAALNRFIGRGPGLTPAGDDFTQAILVTLRTGDDSDRTAFRTLASAITTLLPNTTPLSRTFLEEALRGWAFGPLKTLLEALPDVPSDIVRQLVQIGASSGAAYALGVLMGISYDRGHS